MAKEVKDIFPEVSCKALGIRWNVGQDTFYYVSNFLEVHNEVTKIIMLSWVSLHGLPSYDLPEVHHPRIIHQRGHGITLFL